MTEEEHEVRGEGPIRAEVKVEAEAKAGTGKGGRGRRGRNTASGRDKASRSHHIFMKCATIASGLCDVREFCHFVQQPALCVFAILHAF